MSVLLEAIENFDTIQQGSKKPPRRLTDIPHEVHACYRELSYVCVVQAGEKYLKALMVELGLPVPKTHDLIRLRSLLLPYQAGLKLPRRGMLFLSAFAVETRYPGENTTKRQAAAQRWAMRVRLEIRTRLGLRTKS